METTTPISWADAVEAARIPSAIDVAMGREKIDGRELAERALWRFARENDGAKVVLYYSETPEAGTRLVYRVEGTISASPFATIPSFENGGVVDRKAVLLDVGSTRAVAIPTRYVVDLDVVA